jgi:hypothetical protein
MSPFLQSPGIFEPADLSLLDEIYRDVCACVYEGNEMPLTTSVREVVAISIFETALAGERRPERLRSRAMRQVEAYNGVKRIPMRVAAE